MNIYIIIHGQKDYNVKRLFQLQTDIPLNETGKQQAKEMAEKFRNIKIDIILASPLSRAYQTANYISKVSGVNVEIEEGLKERSFGQMEGQTNKDDCNIEILLDYERNYDLYDVEPVQSFFERVGDSLNKIIEKYKGKNIVLVTHAGVTQAIDVYFNGLPKDKDVESKTLENCGIRKYVM